MKYMNETFWTLYSPFSFLSRSVSFDENLSNCSLQEKARTSVKSVNKESMSTFYSYSLIYSHTIWGWKSSKNKVLPSLHWKARLKYLYLCFMSPSFNAQLIRLMSLIHCVIPMKVLPVGEWLWGRPVIMHPHASSSGLLTGHSGAQGHARNC